ncbi:unnamed protein product [Umbelopsis ramanniana]
MVEEAVWETRKRSREEDALQTYFGRRRERKREYTSSRGLSERRKIGRRSDLIIRSAGKGRNVEYGVAEVGKSFNGEHNLNWLYEGNLGVTENSTRHAIFIS